MNWSFVISIVFLLNFLENSFKLFFTFLTLNHDFEHTMHKVVVTYFLQ